MNSEPATYAVAVHEEDASLWAEVLELPGVFATGDTEDELLASLTEAIALYLELPPATARVRWADASHNAPERLVAVSA
jgi:predicted RNase H-like HicB family nuclease